MPLRTNPAIAYVPLLLLLCGCTLSTQPPDRPDWTEPAGRRGDSVRFISVVGTAVTDKDVDASVREADREARAKLADAVADYVRTAATEFLEAEGETTAQPTLPMADIADRLPAAVAGAVLRNATRRDAWSGPRGRSYVFYRLPVQTIHDAMTEVLSHIPAGRTTRPSSDDTTAARMQQFLARRLQEDLREAVRTRRVTPNAAPQNVPPAWLETGQHERCPPERYFSAIGVGADAVEAQKNGRDEIVYRMQTRLRETVRTLLQSTDNEPLTVNVRSLGADGTGVDDAHLPAMQPVEAWYDPVSEVHYVMVALDRTIASIVYPQKVEQALESCRGARAAGLNNEQADNYAAALRDYFDAVTAARQAVSMQLAALALAPDADLGRLRSIVPEPIVQQARDDLHSLLKRMTLIKTDGDNQWTAPGVPPGKPFRVRLVVGEDRRPVAGVGIALTLPNGSRLNGPTVATDADGYAVWRLSTSLPSGRRSCDIVARVDLSSIGGLYDMHDIPIPETTFQCIVRSKSNTSFALYVRDKTPAGLVGGSSLADALARAMEAESYDLIADDELLRHIGAGELSADAPEPDIVAAFAELRQAAAGGRFLTIIFGTVETRLVQTVATTEGPLYFVHCPFTIKAVDPDLPEEMATMFVLEGVGKGAYAGDQAEAVARAQADAASAASAQLLSALAARFEAGAGPS